MSSVDSGIPGSRRGYLSQDELKQFANITVEDSEEANDIISQSEEIIDGFVGFVRKFISEKFHGNATSGTVTTLIDTSGDSPFAYNDDYFKGCEVEILGGTNEGKRRKIASYDKTNQTITVDETFTTPIDDTSVFIIYQLGKFPRVKDVENLSSVYYRRIPEVVKRAVAAQVKYYIEKGVEFFHGATDYSSEDIGEWRGVNRENIDRVIAPLARQLLLGAGLVNRKGRSA